MPKDIISGKVKYVAVAYTDMDGNDKFQWNKDVLIAGVIDDPGPHAHTDIG